MPTDSKSEWYEQGLHFSCTQSGNCCTGSQGYVWFEEDEGQAMADFLGITLFDFLSQYTRSELGKRTLNETRNALGEYDCVFLKADEQGKRGCSLYNARPHQCRTWPFWPENMVSPQAWEDAARRCPGMANSLKGQGKFYPIEDIRITRDSHD